MSNHKWNFSFDNNTIRSISLEVDIESIGIRTSDTQLAMSLFADIVAGHAASTNCCMKIGQRTE